MDVTWGSGNQHLLSSTPSGASKSATKVLLIASIEKRVKKSKDHNVLGAPADVGESSTGVTGGY